MDEQLKREVWEKATTIEGLDPSMFRADACGAIMTWTHYNKNTSLGWVIDHIFPVSKGGDDNILNLRAMNYANNLSKGSDYPVYISALSKGLTDNVTHIKQFRVNHALQLKLSQLYHISEEYPK